MVLSQDVGCRVSLEVFLVFFRLREPVATGEAFLDRVVVLEADSDARCLRYGDGQTIELKE